MGIASSGCRTTVFCAVWHKDPERAELLRGHAASLEAQTVPVEVVYVFDGGDEPPEDLPGVHVVADHALTIYQAWNIATQVATTQYVMNLNLDDRLAPDAVAVLQATAHANDAGLVGGDWTVVFDTDAADDVRPVHPATDLPFDPTWPPRPGIPRRLGSGTHDLGTFGVASLWRRDLHAVVPYPWRFQTGDLIESVGDTVWWHVAERALRASTVRLPLLIGNYLSRPEQQAEFRLRDERDRTSDPIDIAPYPMDGVEVRR